MGGYAIGGGMAFDIFGFTALAMGWTFFPEKLSSPAPPPAHLSLEDRVQELLAEWSF